jgi:threonine dehydratase
MLATLLDDFVLVSESELEHALSLLLQIEKTVVEGAGAAGLAAVLSHGHLFKGKKVGIVLSAATSTSGCWPMCCCAIWRVRAVWRGCG